jgi:hypothetical protein
MEPSDEAHKVIGKRLSAIKCLRIHRLNKKDDVVERIASSARAHADTRATLKNSAASAAASLKRKFHRAISARSCGELVEADRASVDTSP